MIRSETNAERVETYAKAIESGDVQPYYNANGITLYNLNCLDYLENIKFDLMLTDPPYGIDLKANDKTSKYRRLTRKIINDATQETGEIALKFSKSATIAFASPMKPWSGKWRQHLIWNKGEHVGAGGDPNRLFKMDHELIQIRDTGRLNGKRESSVLNFKAKKSDYNFHPTPKPVSLIEYLLGKIEFEIVCDPFSGAGSTLVAAQNMGKKAIGFELDKGYCEIIVERLRQKVLF